MSVARTLTIIAGLLLLTGSDLHAQNESKPTEAVAPERISKFFRLEYTVKEIENDKVVNSRAYSTVIREHGQTATIRSSGKLPYQQTINANVQYQFLDVGVYIDTRWQTISGNRLVLNVTADITRAEAGSGNSAPAALRSTKWGGDAMVVVGKPNLLFSFDDSGTKRTLQLELTATPMQ